MELSIIEYYLPEKKESSQDLLEENPSWEVDKIEQKTGIKNRFLSALGQTASDLGICAAKKIIDSIDDASIIDLLIFVSQSPDYYLPSSSCIIQSKLGLNKNILAFDLNSGCSGFVQALAVADGLLSAGMCKSGLIICSDTYTKYINKNDRISRPIFSDGAAAILVQHSKKKCLVSYDFGTDGSGFDKLIVKDGGARNPILRIPDSNKPTLEMSGSDVFLFAIREAPNSVHNLLRMNNLSIDEVDLFIFHQASKVVIDSLCEKLKINSEKVFNNYDQIGNTVSATIPIAIRDADNEKKLKRGDLLMVVGFGVGLSWGSALLRY